MVSTKRAPINFARIAHFRLIKTFAVCYFLFYYIKKSPHRTFLNRIWKSADKLFYMVLLEILLQFYIRNLRIGQCLKTAAIMYQEMSSLQPNGN